MKFQLVSADGHVVLTDFGLAQKIDAGQVLKDIVGTMEYFSPEMIKRTGYSYEVDWWAFGVVIFELIVGHWPFSARRSEPLTQQSLQKRILKEEPHMEKLRKVKGNVEVIADLIRKLLIKDREHRLGMIFILLYSFRDVSLILQKWSFNLLFRDFCKIGAGQNGYEDVKGHLFFL